MSSLQAIIWLLIGVFSMGILIGMLIGEKMFKK
jgi:hypothetical protein